jgi:glycosyltransferase involved in cell wall biosynthesis
LDLLPPAIELTVVGSTRDFDATRITERMWSYDVQAPTLKQARVGVAPQSQDEWSLRKAFYKVLEYLAADIIPVVPAYPAVRALLGDELELVAVTAEDESPTAWAAAIVQAFSVPIDERWTAARDRIFARWSAGRLARVMLG